METTSEQRFSQSKTFFLVMNHSGVGFLSIVALRPKFQKKISFGLITPENPFLAGSPACLLAVCCIQISNGLLLTHKSQWSVEYRFYRFLNIYGLFLVESLHNPSYPQFQFHVKTLQKFMGQSTVHCISYCYISKCNFKHGEAVLYCNTPKL